MKIKFYNDKTNKDGEFLLFSRKIIKNKKTVLKPTMVSWHKCAKMLKK